MRKILIDESIENFAGRIKKRTAFCIGTGAAALSLNLLFTLLRTDANHTMMLVLNIVTDIMAGVFITYYASFFILPQKRQLKFSQRSTQMVSGKVIGISEGTLRVLGFDCFAVTIDDRKVFLPDCSNISLSVGEYTTLGVVMNVVTELGAEPQPTCSRDCTNGGTLQDLKKLSAHFQYGLWIYLLIALSAIIFWVTVFNSLASPDSNEKISILFFGSGLDSSGLEEDILGRMESLTEQSIKQVSIEALDTQNQELIVRLLPTRVYDTDLFILSEAVLTDGSWTTFFPAVPLEQMEDISTGEQYYYENDLPYGILIGGGGADNNFTSFYAGEEKYYVFFSSQSVNLANLFSVGEKSDDAALAVLKYLLE